MLKTTVKLFLEKYDLLNAKNNIIVAFSGGYDSMCLLDILMKLQPDYGFNLIAIHLNHNWRGEESDLEEKVCETFCKSINFYSEKLSKDVPHTETAAREARYEFFEKCAKKFNSNIILTAHNANDNAETVYYRIIKGTGITGLEGIQENRGIFYRPLIKCYRSEIENYCKENGLKPNNDGSNTDTKYARNKIRYEIFPKLKEFNPNIEKSLNDLSESAKCANKIINAHIKSLEKYSPKEFILLDETYQNAVVHRFFRELGLDYDKKVILKIVEFLISNSASKSGKTISLTTDKWLFVNDKKIEVLNKKVKENCKIKIDHIGKYDFEDFVFEIRECKEMPKKFPKDSEMKAYICAEKIDFTLRHRNDGDFIKPFGLKGSQKLKKYFNEKKIPNHEKDDIILLCNGNEVLWVAGYGLSDGLKVSTNPTHVIELRRK